MKRIICEICGSSAIVKRNGVFECENCGTSYEADQVKNLLTDVEDIAEEAPVNVPEEVCCEESAAENTAETVCSASEFEQPAPETEHEGGADYVPENPSSYEIPTSYENPLPENNAAAEAAYPNPGMPTYQHGVMLEKKPVRSKAPIIIAIVAVVLLFAVMGGLVAAEYVFNFAGIFKPRINEIAIGEFDANFQVGDTYLMYFTTEPQLKGSEADKLDVAWTSSDTSVATVDNDGKLRAIGKGTCIITLQYGKLASTCTVTVKEFTEEELKFIGKWDNRMAGDVPILDSSNGITLTVNDDYTASFYSTTVDTLNDISFTWESLGYQSTDNGGGYVYMLYSSKGSFLALLIDDNLAVRITDDLILYYSKEA